MLLLSTLFALSTISATIVVAAASVIGYDLSGTEALATLPVALALLGAMAATLPASHAMARWGRRAGFAGGTAVALLGAAVAGMGILRTDFWLFCLGSFLLGVLGGVSPYYRFTAVEVTLPHQHARAIAFVLAGGVAAGLLGPHLGAAARDLWPEAPFAGAYAVMALLGLVILLILPFLQVPPPAPKQASSGRRLVAIARDPRAVAAVLAAVTAFAAMVLTMVAAPLSLRHGGHGFGDVAFVIQAHVVAMFAPSFVSGPLVARWGPGRAMGFGIGLILACVATNVSGDSVVHHWVALVLLGIGWNFLFVAGTTLLTRVHRPEEKARVQGTNDLLVASTGAAAALLAGPLLGALGWGGLNVAVGAFVLTAALALALLLWTSRRQDAPARNPL